MKAWIMRAVLAGGILIAHPLFVHAQAQAGAQARSQAAAASQQAAPQQQAQAAPAAQQAPAPTPAGGQMRDPFRPIETKGPAVDLAPVCTQSGMAGTLIGQVQLQGIASDVEGRWLAVVDNKTGRAYFLRQGDKLCNGVVTRVEQESLVMEESTTDSFGRTRTREVILRPDAN